jgi:chorismate-pyruvate lyase
MLETEVHALNELETLPYCPFDFSGLSLLQKMFLLTDGTLTKIIEAYAVERLQVVKLAERMAALAHDMPPLQISIGQEVIERKILLQGIVSRRNWLYAESLIIPDRLDPHFKDRLLHSREPIGKLWIEHKTETFREVLASFREPAGEVAAYFTMPPAEHLLCRSYRVFSNRKPVMLITEKFPESYFA